MQDKRSGEKRQCYYHGPKSSIVIPIYLSEGRDSEYIPHCDLNWHTGIVLSQNIRICEKRKCRHYDRLRPETGPWQLRRYIRKKQVHKTQKDPKVAVYQSPRDSVSSFVPYCTNSEHPGIILESKQEKCLEQACSWYMKFRPRESRRPKCQKPTIILKSFEDLDASMLKR